MTIREMHYDLKMKINKVDSQQNKNLKVPEIDWVLNEAQELFVKRIAEPRRYNGLGVETSQRAIDDIRTIVVSNFGMRVKNDIIALPNDYWFLLSAHAYATKGKCKEQKLRVMIRQHDDLFNQNSFTKSSFEWREVNGTFSVAGISLHTDGDFKVDRVSLDYIKQLPYIHNAQDFNRGTYKNLKGEVLTGSRDCPLPSHTHREIVDLAVLMVSGQLQTPGYQIHQAKAALNDLVN